jgi:hypothetical protein
MNSYDTSNSVDMVERIRREIETLRKELSDALKTATFVGMTAEEAKAYDARRKQLTALVEQLSATKHATEEPEPIV